MRSIFCVLIQITLSIGYQYFANNGSLKLVQILFRHGERSPTETYPNDPYIDHKWPGGFGFLNNRGKLEMYNLGLQLRNHYSNFLPEYYYRPQLMVYSSYSDRCLVSAELLLAGLFPPVGEQIWNQDLLWQPIPVHYNPRNLDNTIAMKQNCPKYDDALKDAYNSNRTNEIYTQYPGLLKYLSIHTGQEIKDITDIEFLYNTLEIEELNNLTLPKWTMKYYPEPMKTIAAESLAIFTQTPLMKRLKGGVFLKNVTDNMRLSIEKKTEKILILFSGHDISIVNVWRSLGFDTLLKPDFAAALIFELHNNNEVKIFYKKNVTTSMEELKIPNCNAPCNLDTFVQALEPILPVNWDEECSYVV